MLGVHAPQNISCIRNRFMVVNEYSFLCCCSHLQCVQGLELCLWQPDWNHISQVLQETFWKCPTSWPCIQIFFALGLVLLLTGEKESMIGCGEMGIEGKLGWESLGMEEWWGIRTEKKHLGYEKQEGRTQTILSHSWYYWQFGLDSS